MLKRILFFFTFILSVAVFAQNTYHLPKVLLLTTGADEGRGTVSDGIVLALQDFNKLGVSVSLQNREILLQPKSLSKYDILIIPTIKGYHDKPQNFSLTYMSNYELQNINNWVRNGGTLLSDTNVGRNDLKGVDRLLNNNLLNKENWILAESFGLNLRERNTLNTMVVDSEMKIWKHHILRRKNKEVWQLVPENIQKDVKVLAHWQIDNTNLPAVTIHNFGKGKAILLPTFYMLHPIKDGGLSSEKQINQFYKLVYETAIGKRTHHLQISPWKDGHTSVYCQTFDDGGNMEQYQRVFNFINKNKLPTVFFVTPEIDNAIAKKLQKEKLISIQGHSFNHPDFREISYFETQNELLMNRQFWEQNFKGFRFPYVSNSFWGLFMLNKFHFLYDTSIAANHIDFIRGSVVPYNIPIFKDDFYTTLDLIEISQIYHSDWYFYQQVLEKKAYKKTEQQRDAQKFKEYLINYFDKVAQPNNGVMVYLGHPMYVGISNTTLQALQDLIDYLQNKNVWFASLNEVADRWLKIQRLHTEITEKDNQINIRFTTNDKIEAMSIFLDKKPKLVKEMDKYKLIKTIKGFCIVFDVEDKTEINIIF